MWLQAQLMSELKAACLGEAINALQAQRMVSAQFSPAGAI